MTQAVVYIPTLVSAGTDRSIETHLRSRGYLLGSTSLGNSRSMSTTSTLGDSSGIYSGDSRFCHCSIMIRNIYVEQEICAIFATLRCNKAGLEMMVVDMDMERRSQIGSKGPKPARRAAS